MAAMLPIIIGGRILQVAAPRAIALVEAGVARMLPSMRTVGSQSAGPGAAGSYFRTAANLPAMADRPGLIGKGLAGGAAAGSLAMGGPEASVPPEGRVPIPPGMISQLDERGAAAPARRLVEMSPLRGQNEDLHPSLFEFRNTALPVQSFPADPAAPPVSSDMSARFLDGPAAPLPVEVRSTDSTLFGEDVGPRPAPVRSLDSTLSGYDMPPERAARNAVRVAQSVMPQAPRPTASGPSARDLWTRYNESESPADFVRADKALLADKAMLAALREGRAEGGGIPEGMMGARPMPIPNLDLPPMDGPPPMSDMPPLGGMSPATKPAAGAGAGGRDAAINKALEIIHHLVIRGR